MQCQTVIEGTPCTRPARYRLASGQHSFLCCDECIDWWECQPGQPPAKIPLNTTRERLLSAIDIMDKKGRRSAAGDSVLLWGREWSELRAILLTVLEDDKGG